MKNTIMGGELYKWSAEMSGGLQVHTESVRDIYLDRH